jgi:thiamine-monophosphate kinase
VNIVGGETSRGDQLIITVSMSGTAPAKDWVARNRARAGDCLFVTGQLGGSIKRKHLHFHPRVQEAQWLVKHTRISAMMDLSDGLGKDLPRLAASCGVGFHINLEDLPLTRGCSVQQAVGDGAVSAKNSIGLLSEWSEAFPKLKLTRIGKLVADPQSRGIPSGGWEHFR